MSAMRDGGYREELAKLTPGLRRFARALVDDHKAEAADDLVQATLVTALADGKARRGGQLYFWMLGLMVSHHRRSLRMAAKQEVGARHGSATGAGGAAGWESPQRARAKTAAFFGDMPLESREVLLLVSLEHLSYVQTAECLGLTLNAVIGHLARAREYLAGRHGEPAAAGAPLKSVTRRATHLRVIK